MAKTFGMWAAATTGLTAVGTLRNFTKTTNAEVTYSRNAAGVADSDDGGIVQPVTVSGQGEVDGTVPAAGTTLTVDSVVYILTKVGTTYEVPGATVFDFEATENK